MNKMPGATEMVSKTDLLGATSLAHLNAMAHQEVLRISPQGYNVSMGIGPVVPLLFAVHEVYGVRVKVADFEWSWISTHADKLSEMFEEAFKTQDYSTIMRLSAYSLKSIVH